MDQNLSLQAFVQDLENEKRKNEIIRFLSFELSKTSNLKEKLNNILAVLDLNFNLKHTMLLLPDATHQRLKVFASRGFEDKGIGSEVNFGEGIIGVVALRKRKLRIVNIARRRQYVQSFAGAQVEQVLPGLPNVESQVALPLLANGELIAVLSAESASHNFFSPEDEDFLMTLSQIMALSIQNALIIEQLEAKVQERTSAIEAQKRELEKVNASKDRLFAVIGHDLRSPAASLQNVSQLIQYYNKKGDLQQLNELGGKIVNVAKSLTGMLDNLLSWSVTQTGDIQLQTEKISLTNLIREVREAYEDMAQSKQILISVESPEELFIWADKNASLTILRNLLSNALKFTKPNGHIQIRIDRKEQAAQIIFADNGVGIAPQQLPTLFELRENKSTKGTAKEKGTGLGLVLVKEMVHLNQGHISVESQLGEGSTVYLTLPLCS